MSRRVWYVAAPNNGAPWEAFRHSGAPIPADGTPELRARYKWIWGPFRTCRAAQLALKAGPNGTLFTVAEFEAAARVERLAGHAVPA
jgi:hypothetical protein